MRRAHFQSVRSLLVILTLTVSTFLGAQDGWARHVFLNGVDLAGVDLPAVTLKACDVHIDAKGNIHITARGYKIQVDGASGKGSASPHPRANAPRPGSNSGSVSTIGSATGRYYLVSFFNNRGATQYDIEVFINGTLVRRIRAHAAQVAMDVTRFIKRGQRNEVIFVARKSLGTRGRISASSMDYFRVVLGSGFESKGQIVLKSSLLETRRTAAETRSAITEKHVVIFR